MKIEKAEIISHDLGVSVVQELIANDLENKNSFQISSIAFLNGGLFSSVYQPRFLQRLLSNSPDFIGKFLSKLISRKSIEKTLKEVFGENTFPKKEELDLFWEILNFNDGKSISYLIGRMVFEKIKYQKRWIEAMKKTNIPFCYICGPKDPNSGIHMANEFTKILPNKKVYLLDEKIGHWAQIESPREVFQFYEEFKSKLNL